MTFIFNLLLLIFTVFILDIITSRKLINPYIIIGLFGKPGSGKSILLTKLMYRHVKKGWVVYSDVQVNIPGVKYFDALDFKNGLWLPDGRPENQNIVLFFDEIGILYNNRDFRNNLDSNTLEWWKMHRHKRVKVIYASQSYKDMDLKIRNITDRLYLIKRGFLKNFSIAKRINIKMDIENTVDSSGNNQAGGQIVEKFNYDLPIFWYFTFMRRWISKFDSYR